MDDAEACRRKMTNATALIQGLSGERVRWTEASKGFQAQIHRLVGDVLLCTGFLSYTGPFNQEFRNLILKNWKKEMIAQKIPFSDVSLLGYLLGEQFMKSNKILSSRQDVLSVIYWFDIFTHWIIHPFTTHIPILPCLKFTQILWYLNQVQQLEKFALS